MARTALFLITIFLLGSCADIVPLTGGEEDRDAPAVVSQEPPQGTTSYNGNQIVVEFDEYVKLNDPNTTITINPAMVKLKSELEKKTLRISWDGQLEQNTTYIIQLNAAVKDINEANDSIMQLVFSTGPVIDSLKLNGRISGAFSGNAVSQATVGLYHPDSSVLRSKPIYATRSNAKGEFAFSYLKPGNYQLFAFSDANKDQRLQPDEAAGFTTNTVQAGDTIVAAISLFPRAAAKGILRAELVPPAAAVVYNIDSLDLSKLKVNGEQPALLNRFSADSILVSLPEGPANFSFRYDSTVVDRQLTAIERKVSLKLTRIGTDNWKTGDSLKFSIPDAIKTLDTSAISIRTVKGQAVSYTYLQQELNKIVLIPAPGLAESFEVRFEKNAIKGSFAVNDTVQFSYTTLLKADLSNLKINCKGFEGQWVFQLMQNDKALYSQIKQAGDTIVEFTQIIPGTYNLRCIEDLNQNGRWDTGNVETKLQPEIVKRFTLKQKLRPNWDVEETVIAE